MKSQTTFSGWWGRHSVEPNRTDFWQIGPLQLWLQHLEQQWRISWKQGPDWLESQMRSTTHESGPPADAQVVNCAFGAGTREDLLFQPALPERSLITRLETPLNILSGEKVTLYVISPLSLRIEMAGSGKLIYELPTFRLSDTWFGPLSGAGELCYASSAPAFLDLASVPLRLHCAISAVHIQNDGEDSLKVDRVKIPLPRLSLFYSPRTGFWTDAFSLIRREDSEMATMRLNRQPPPDASPTQFVASPRNPQGPDAGSMIRAFSALFKDRGSM